MPALPSTTPRSWWNRRSNGPSRRTADRAISARRRPVARLAATFAEHGHDAIHVETVFPPRTPDATIGTYARDHGYCLVTGDYDFSDVREFAPQRFPGIVVLTLPQNAGPEFIGSLVREFLARLPDLGPLGGKLLIVERGRIRIRE